MEASSMTFNLRTVRVDHLHMKPAEFAARIGISVRQLQYYESGQKTIPPYLQLATERLVIEREHGL
jgi:DNA-binding transcriptional regulator YiaG